MLLALMLVVGVLVFPNSASATHDLHDFVVGGFRPNIGSHWSVSAQSGPMGEEPFGHVSATTPSQNPDQKQFRYRVTCVNVDGNLAVIGAVPTEAASNDTSASPALFFLRDGGPGGGEGPGDAQLDGFFFTGTDNPNQCQDPSSLAVAAIAPPIESGNILVHDAAAVELP
jgi:hypothetical protein